MQKGKAFCVGHIEAIKREGTTANSYAKRHNLSVNSPYQWPHKINAHGLAVARPNKRATFVAVRLAEPKKNTRKAAPLTGAV